MNRDIPQTQLSLDGLLLISLVVIVVLAVLFAAGTIVARRRRREGRPESFGETVPSETSHRVTDSQAAPQDEGPREIYKSVALETDWEMKVRLYTPDEYRTEFGRDAGTGFVGVAKAYRPIADRWNELPPETAAGLLELPEGDYEVDPDHNALLLRKFPPGTPIEAQGL